VEENCISEELETFTWKKNVYHINFNQLILQSIMLSAKGKTALEEKWQMQCCLFWTTAKLLGIWQFYMQTASGIDAQHHPIQISTPYEMLYGVKPDLSHIKIFGSPLLLYIPKTVGENFNQNQCQVLLCWL
jgi:hypothetical protein